MLTPAPAPIGGQVEDKHTQRLRILCAGIRMKRRRSRAIKRPPSNRLSVSTLNNSRRYNVSTRSKCNPSSANTRSKRKHSSVLPGAGGGGGGHIEAPHGSGGGGGHVEPPHGGGNGHH